MEITVKKVLRMLSANYFKFNAKTPAKIHSTGVLNLKIIKSEYN